MKLGIDVEAKLLALLQAPDMPFSSLVKAVGLDPTKDLAGTDLGGVHFGEADLSGWDFTGCDLRGADFSSCDFSGANFVGANTTDAIWAAESETAPRAGAAAEASRRWPWLLAPRRRRPRILGDVPGAIAFGMGPDAAAIERTSALLAVGVPGDGPCTAEWSVSPVGSTRPSQCDVSITSSDAQIMQTFNKTDAGTLEVDLGLYALSSNHQGVGLNKAFLRNSLLLYEQLKVTHAVFYANYELGAYTWAKLGGVPVDPDHVRLELVDRANKVARMQAWPAGDLVMVVDIIHLSPDATLMYDVARTVNAVGEPLGKVLLAGYGWSGFWDLADESQMARVVQALT